MTAGARHHFFWEFKKNEKKRGIAGKHGMISHQVCAWDAEGVAYSGAADGRIFVWKERECVESKEAHKGFIQSIRCVGKQLFTGGRDGMVMVHSTGDLTPGKVIDFGSKPCAIDFLNGSLLVGVRDGTIYHFEDYEDEASKKAIMHSHDNGEVWGLASCGVGYMVTTGDDNKVMCWDVEKRILAK